MQGDNENRTGIQNPMNSVKITVPSSYQHPADVLSDDVRGEKQENEARNTELGRIMQSGPAVAEAEAGIKAARQKLESGYYRRDGNGHRLYITPFGAVPANEEEGEK